MSIARKMARAAQKRRPARPQPLNFLKPQSVETPTDPGDGLVRIFLDDERPAPAGWTVVRSVSAFLELLDQTPDDTIGAVAFDWYMGGFGRPNGEQAIQPMLEKAIERPGLFSRCRAMTFHSSDRENAVRMARMVNGAVEEGSLPDLRIRLGMPSSR